MPRYFFHIREGEHFVLDEEGMEFDDLEAAKHEAHERCREMIIERLKGHQKFSGLTVEVADESGKVFAAISAGDHFN